MMMMMILLLMPLEFFQENEMLVNRVYQVKKIVRRLRKERKWVYSTYILIELLKTEKYHK